MSEPPGPFTDDGDTLQSAPERTVLGFLRRRWPAVGWALGTVVLGAGFYQEHVRGRPVPFVDGMDPLDWLFGVALLVGAALCASLARHPVRARTYARRLRERPAALVSVAATGMLLLVGLVGPMFVTEPTELVFSRAWVPPVGATVDTQFLTGPCPGDVVNGRCRGTLAYPFGTTRAGRSLFPFVVLGARTAVEIATVSALLLVPVGIGVGLVSGLVGGRVDAALMRLADVLATVPAVIVYILFWGWNAEYRLLALVFAFGLVNWGGLARAVRNETLELRDREFVQAARVSGIDDVGLALRHLLPNVSRQVFSTLALQVPLLVVTEAALSFVILPVRQGEATLGDPTVVSWGQLIFTGVRVDGLVPAWWVTAIPTAALVLTTLALAGFFRSLSDVVAPVRLR